MFTKLKTYIVLDESGAFHLKNDNYFIIGGFITNHLHKVRSIHKKIERRIGYNNKELKAFYLKPQEKAMFLNETFKNKDIIPIAIVVDKHNVLKKEIEENTIYNLLIKYMLSFLFEYHSYLFKYEEICLLLDNRSIKVKYKNQLETYLYLELNNKFKYNYMVRYLDSIHYREIQIADYIANYLYGKYNYYNLEKTSTYIKNYNKIIIFKFPYNNFQFPYL